METLHDLLLKADVGPSAASRLVERVRARWSRDADAESLLREEMVEILGPDRGSPCRMKRLARPSSWGQRVGEDDDDRQAGETSGR